jgi:outer membrane lipopolysaccharide assembly protein LptE/RlpB
MCPIHVECMMKTFSILFSILVISSCGYHLGAGPSRPSDFGTVAVPIFVNESPEPKIQSVITGAMIQELAQAGVLVVNEAQADKVLTGRIVSYSNQSVARSAASTVSEYRLAVGISLDLKNREGEILYQNPSAQLREEYFASSTLEENEQAEAEALQSGAVDFAEDEVRHILDGISIGLGNDRL